MFTYRLSKGGGIMPYEKRESQLRGMNKWSIGDIGESWVKYKLAQHKIDTIIIDRTYDLFAWKRNHRIEVKTSQLTKPERGYNHKINYYSWYFKNWQTKKDAFDYAVLVGLDDNLQVDVYYIVPQKYIYLQAKDQIRKHDGSGIHIWDSGNNNNVKKKFYLEGNCYDKFECCRNIDFKLFLQNNKSAFMRKKNALTQQLIDFPIVHQMKVLQAVKDAFNDKTIKYPTKELMKKFNCSWDQIKRAKNILGIDT